MCEVRVAGRAIRASHAHPFWVKDRGWVAAASLEPGWQLSGHDGQWLPVESVRDLPGGSHTVYNFAVHEDHTYFIGRPDWGFAVSQQIVQPPLEDA